MGAAPVVVLAPSMAHMHICAPPLRSPNPPPAPPPTSFDVKMATPPPSFPQSISSFVSFAVSMMKQA